MATSIQVTVKGANGTCLSYVFNSTADEEGKIFQKDLFAMGLASVRKSATTDQNTSDLAYEVEGTDGGQLLKKASTMGDINKISDEYADRIERDEELKQNMDDVIGNCKSNFEDDVGIIQSHLRAVYDELKNKIKKVGEGKGYVLVPARA